MSVHDIVPTTSPEDQPNASSDEPGPASDKPSGASGKCGGRRDAIPSEEDCLRAIAKLPGLVALKILSPSQANSIRANYESLLRHHYQSQASRPSQISDDRVLAILCESPELLSLLEPLLTDEQIALIGRNVKESDGAEV
jgi:hypothetical protein